ncbi:MAG TPA: protein kinase [Elusimicrobiota bacterium]|nr:protein kinase [Elusimicrobiota bacterium]
MKQFVFLVVILSFAPRISLAKSSALDEAIQAASATSGDAPTDDQIDQLRAQIPVAVANLPDRDKDPKAFFAYLSKMSKENPLLWKSVVYAVDHRLLDGIRNPPKPVKPDPEKPAPPVPAVPASPASPPSAAASRNPAAPGPAGADTPPVQPPGWGIGIAMAQQQVQNNPDDPQANLALGQMYYAAHDYRPAYNSLDTAVSKGANGPDVMVMLAGSALHLGDYQTAASAAQKALESDPSNQEALAIYHFSKDQAPAVKLPSSLGELAQGRSPESLPNGGAGSLPNGIMPAGSGFFRSAPPPSGMTAEQAAELAKQAAAPGSDAPARSREFTQDAANAMRVRDYPTAYDLSSKAINLNPQNAQALNYRAMSLSQMRRYSDAVQDASAALGLAPGNPAALHTRSWAFSKEKKYKEALDDANMASAAEPNNAYLYQDKALALAGLGDRAGALDALRRSAALDPRFTTRLEQATQLPQDSDMTLLFDDGATAAALAVPPSPGSRQRRFVRLAALSGVGGLLIALGILHVVSASWRDRMRMTVRRVLGPSPSVASASAPAADAPGAGSFWSQYQVVKEIGLGGMGVVYEATDRSLERRVAVKKMRDEIRLDPQDRQRFVNEARLVAQLHHPSIVDIYGIVEDGNDVYLVFEFVEGRTLHDALKSGGPMDLPKARGVLKEMADAIEHAHGRNIIHRDLKPSNVMLTPEGRVKVMDFGIARMAKDAMTRHSMTNTIAGTPPYMAPEQEQGTVRRESDVYALGVCLYEMTTGFLPFSGSGAAMLLNKLNGKLIPATQRNPALPAGLDAVIAKALQPDADQRYRTPAELVAAIDGLSVAA